MIQPEKSFWQVVATRAWQDTNHTLFGTRTNFVIGILLFCIYVLLIWTLVNGQMAWEEILLKFYASAAPLLLYPALYLWNFLYASPSKIYRDGRNRINDLTKRLTPSLSLSLPKGKAVTTMEWGGTSESMAGTRQTVIHRQMTVVRLTCTNDSDHRIDNCRASLIDARGVDEIGEVFDIGYRETLGLSWSRNLDQKEFSTSIEPGVSKSIYLIGQNRQGPLIIYRGNEIPLEYHQIFSSQSHVRLWVQVNGENVVADRMCIDVKYNELEKKITTEIVCSDFSNPLC